MSKPNERIKEIEERIEWMQDNYFGCDWCDECEGGDIEMNELETELSELRAKG